MLKERDHLGEGTPTPTSTLTPTSTVTPTRTPTPTPGPPILYVLPNHLAFVDTVGYLITLGEVHNGTTDYLRYVSVDADIFDGSGQLLATIYSPARLDNLPPGTSTCIRGLMKEPAGWSTYEFRSPTAMTGGHPFPRLSVVSDSGAYDPHSGDYRVSGTLRNDHGSRVNFATIVGTLYAADNTVIGCQFYYGPSLDPGETKDFSMRFYGRNYADATRYRLQADGTPSGE